MEIWNVTYSSVQSFVYLYLMANFTFLKTCPPHSCLWVCSASEINIFCLFQATWSSFNICVFTAQPHWHSLEIFLWFSFSFFLNSMVMLTTLKTVKIQDSSIVLFYFLVVAEDKSHFVPKIPICSPERSWNVLTFQIRFCSY